MDNKDLLKIALEKYKKENYYVQSWEEYNNELSVLIDKVTTYVKKKNIVIDAVVPILRGGNIPATFLAYTLNILTILPVQYKYFFLPGVCELRRLLSINKKLITNMKPTFLLVEGNHCYGNQAKYAASDLKKSFPKATIIYAASNMDYNYQDVVKDAKVSFYGRLTNCCKELTKPECNKLRIEYEREPIFPWENIQEEWKIVELKQYKYNNVNELRNSSPLIKKFPL